jgi:phosphoribosylaminoimidazolecarboxamide formyltransferase/IMP cyclohydrolase
MATSHAAVTGSTVDGIRIRRALLSVSDKTGLTAFASFLSSQGVELLSTGGTAKALREANIPVVEVDAFTGFPEILSGRVKTLHPKVHGALLAVRGNVQHEQQLTAHGIGLIDLIVVNLYPFQATVDASSADYSKCVENIDIGGPAMIRSAAKNHSYVAVLTNAAQYAEVQREMESTQGQVGLKTRKQLAAEAFTTTAQYDTAISTYLLSWQTPSTR